MRTRAKSISFQLKMKQISEVAAIPGHRDRGDDPGEDGGQPGAVDLGGLDQRGGTSARKDCIIHTAIGRFIEV